MAGRGGGIASVYGRFASVMQSNFEEFCFCATATL